MEDKFAEYVKANSQKFETNIDGSFDCQHCGEYVNRAFHDVDYGMLVWKCKQGHMSKLKEFNVG